RAAQRAAQGGELLGLRARRKRDSQLLGSGLSRAGGVSGGWGRSRDPAAGRPALRWAGPHPVTGQRAEPQRLGGVGGRAVRGSATASRHWSRQPRRTRMNPSSMAAFRSWAAFDTRSFFIMLARCASTVFTLILRRVPISRFLRPFQINWRISCSRSVKDVTPFLLFRSMIALLLMLKKYNHPPFLYDH